MLRISIPVVLSTNPGSDRFSGIWPATAKEPKTQIGIYRIVNRTILEIQTKVLFAFISCLQNDNTFKLAWCTTIMVVFDVLLIPYIKYFFQPTCLSGDDNVCLKFIIAVTPIFIQRKSC